MPKKKVYISEIQMVPTDTESYERIPVISGINRRWQLNTRCARKKINKNKIDTM